MGLKRFLHEQYDSVDENPVIFECTECGYRSQSLGWLHSHVETHIPFPKQLFFSDWMDYTRVLEATETEETDLESVQNL